MSETSAAGQPSFEQHDWAEPDLLLMADESLIESAQNADFRLCPLEKEPEPVLLPTEIWEGGDGENPRPFHQDPLDGTVLHDPYTGRFHTWYRTHNRMLRDSSDPAQGDSFKVRGFKTQGSVHCYAFSDDGINWHKPALGAVKFDGSYRNNMINVSEGPILTGTLGGVVPNYLENASYKLIGTVFSNYRDNVYDKGITQIYSNDGIRWTPHYPPTLPLDGDAHCLMWNSREQCYLCTTRSAAHENMIRRLRERGVHLPNKRHIALAKSKDLVHWTPMQTILEVDEEDGDNAQMYQMHIVPYGHLYLGFVQMFYVGERMTYGPLDIQLAVSRDLKLWRRMSDRSPVLARGVPGEWDQSHVSLHTCPPHPQGNRMRFWYGGKNTEHWQAGSAAMGSATLRRDGFACWEAGTEGGIVTTKPLRLDWATWPMLNVDATDGEIRLEILDENEVPIEGCSADDCLPITGDHIRVIVEFKKGRGNFVRHTGPVRFRFHLKNAKLYAVKIPNVTLITD